MEKLRELGELVRLGAKRIVEIEHERKESPSGRVETTVTRYVCRINTRPFELVIEWTVNYKTRQRNFRVASQRQLEEGEYYTLAKGRKFLDTQETLAKMKEGEELSENLARRPCCEKCGHKMVVRRSRFGSFWGCQRYPDCDGTRRFV